MLWRIVKMAMKSSRPCTHTLVVHTDPAKGEPVSTSFKCRLDHVTNFAQSYANKSDTAEAWKVLVPWVPTSCRSCKLEITMWTKRVIDWSYKGLRCFVGCTNSLTWPFSDIVYKTVISMFSSRSAWNDAVSIQSCPVILHLKTEISVLNISGRTLNASPFVFSTGIYKNRPGTRHPQRFVNFFSLYWEIETPPWAAAPLLLWNKTISQTLRLLSLLAVCGELLVLCYSLAREQCQRQGLACAPL